MKMNDADYFGWIAENLRIRDCGMSLTAITYINRRGDLETFRYNYVENGIYDISLVEDKELLRRIIDKIIESEVKNKS